MSYSVKRDLLKETSMKLKGIANPIGLLLLFSVHQTGHFELLWCDVQLFHETAQHVIYQILVVIVDFHDLGILFVHFLIGIEHLNWMGKDQHL